MGNVGSNGAANIDPDSLPDDCAILRVWFKSATNLSNALGGDLDGLADPYVLLFLTKEHDELGDQRQTTSVKKDTLDPDWTPPEMFTFVIPHDWDLTKVSLICELMDFDRVGADDSLGNSVLPLREIGYNEDQVQQTLPILHPKTNTDTQGTSSLVVDLVSKTRAFATEQHVLIEYQRWQARGWGSKRPGHFLPTDRVNRWGTLDGSFTDQEFTTVEAHACEIRENHVVEKDWHFINPVGCHDGWEYATFFGTKVWSAHRGIRCCRRRFWRRTTIDQAALDEMEADAGPPTAAADGGGAAEAREEALGSLGKTLLASNLTS